MEKQFDKKVCIRCENRITDNRNFVCEKCWNEARAETKMELELLCATFGFGLIDEEDKLRS